MKIVVMILMVCWPFGGRRTQQPPIQRHSVRAGMWFTTPHYDDGYWVEYAWKKGSGLVRVDDADPTINPGYPFHHYRWELPGYLESATTWHFEDFPGKIPAKPERKKFIPDYDPFLPGTRFNL